MTPAAACAVGVTGFGGFLGGEFAAALAASGHQVTDLDAYCRLPDPENLHNFPAKLDWVLHCAARTSIAQSVQDPEGFLQANLAATRAALDVAVSRRAAVICLSSYVYGQPQYNPIDEDHPLSELNPYMASKLAGERLATSLCVEHDLPLVVLRPFSVYGRRRQPGRLVSDLLDCLRAGEQLAINDATPRRDYLYVADFCELICAVVARQPACAGVYNVGSGVDLSNLEVAETLRHLAGDARPVVVRGQPRANDVHVCVADLRKVSAAFAWQPRWSLEDGLRDLLERMGLGSAIISPAKQPQPLAPSAATNQHLRRDPARRRQKWR